MGIKRILSKVRDYLIYVKFCMGRTTSYLALINSGMILFIFLSKLKDAGIIHSDLEDYFVVIFITGFLLLILVGIIEVKYFKGMREESRLAFGLTPQFVNIEEKLNLIYDEIKRKND